MSCQDVAHGGGQGRPSPHAAQRKRCTRAAAPPMGRVLRPSGLHATDTSSVYPTERSNGMGRHASRHRTREDSRAPTQGMASVPRRSRAHFAGAPRPHGVRARAAHEMQVARASYAPRCDAMRVAASSNLPRGPFCQPPRPPTGCRPFFQALVACSKNIYSRNLMCITLVSQTRYGPVIQGPPREVVRAGT